MKIRPIVFGEWPIVFQQCCFQIFVSVPLQPETSTKKDRASYANQTGATNPNADTCHVHAMITTPHERNHLGDLGPESSLSPLSPLSPPLSFLLSPLLSPACKRLRTLANDCGCLRTIADACVHKRNDLASPPGPLDPHLKTGTLLLRIREKSYKY